MIIMPSTPRLRTPERSTTSSPDAARSSGVEAVITVRMKLTENISFRISMTVSSMGGRGFACAAQQTDAIDDQRVASQHVKQQDALEHFGQVERNLDRNLRLLAADKGQREKQSGDQYAHRIEAAEEGNDNGREAVTGRNT